jgi:predicted regulator of Ras-like GTPase activity (Roadblock/LC7/MglB family)
MPYRDVLKRLLQKIEGAAGAGFVASDGEAVQLEGQLDDFAHRLHLAYQGILLQALSNIHGNPKANLQVVLSIHQDYTVAVKPLADGYFLVLTLKRGKNLHQVVRYLEQAAEELNREL